MERDPSHRFPTLQKPQVKPLRAFLSIMSPHSLLPHGPRVPRHWLERTVEKGMRRGGTPSEPNPPTIQPSSSSPSDF